jgi:hypothetical protein
VAAGRGIGQDAQSKALANAAASDVLGDGAVSKSGNHWLREMLERKKARVVFKSEPFAAPGIMISFITLRMESFARLTL